MKTKRGPQVLDGLTTDSTVAELKAKLLTVTEIAEAQQHILWGFPPKKLDTSNNTRTLKDVGLANGDTLIVEDKPGHVTGASAAQEAADQELAESLAAAENSEFNGVLMKKVVPADNSCLFTSIGEKAHVTGIENII